MNDTLVVDTDSAATLVQVIATGFQDYDALNFPAFTPFRDQGLYIHPILISKSVPH